MKCNLNLSDDFTLEDIRKIRDDHAARYTDKDGNIDWDGLNLEIEEGAAKGYALIARLRAERLNAEHAIAQ